MYFGQMFSNCILGLGRCLVIVVNVQVVMFSNVGVCEGMFVLLDIRYLWVCVIGYYSVICVVI